MPGFAILFELGCAAAGAQGIQVEGDTSSESANRDDVPDFARPDVGSEEIDTRWRVGVDVPVATVPEGAHLEESTAITAGALHLHAPDTRAGVDPDVVGLVVAKGLPDGKTAAGSLEHEVEFGEIANVFCAAAASKTTLNR